MHTIVIATSDACQAPPCLALRNETPGAAVNLANTAIGFLLQRAI
jgi:hypothetical protein